MGRTYKPGYPALGTTLADHRHSYNSEVNTKSRTQVRSFEEATVNRGLYNCSKNLAIFIPEKANPKGHTIIKSKFLTMHKIHNGKLLVDQMDTRYTFEVSQEL